MFIIEGRENGFTSIPRSIYWAIVTLTTVGYGDIAPQTTAGQLLAMVLMVTGYGVIAVPTGLVTAALVQKDFQSAVPPSGGHMNSCPSFGNTEIQVNARFCKQCGRSLFESGVPGIE